MSTMNKREITTDVELCSFLNQIAVEAPEPVQHIFNGQLQVIRSIQSPTIVDSALTRMIDCLYDSLDECPNDYVKKKMRKQFSSMIENLIFFLDVKLQATLSDNKKLAENLFLQAGDCFMDNIKNAMIMATNTFGTGAKVLATSLDAGKDFMIVATGLATEVNVGIAGSDISLTTDTNASSTDNADGSSTDTVDMNSTLRKGPVSDETAKTMADVGKTVIETVDSHRGEYSREVCGHISQWVQDMNDVVIHDIFSPSQNEKRRELFDTFFQFVTRGKNEGELWDNFFTTICNTIEKLEKYRQIIGPSIIISDMIERYVKLIRQHWIAEERKISFGSKMKSFLENRKSDSVPQKSPKTATVAGEIVGAAGAAFVGTGGLIVSAAAMAGIAVSSFLKRSEEKGQTAIEVLERYQKVADCYDPLKSEL